MPFGRVSCKLSLLVCLLCCALASTAQKGDMPMRGPDSLSDNYRYSSHTTSHISLLAGYHGVTYSFFELGVAANTKGRVGYHPFAAAYYASSECRIDRDKFIIGPKIGCWGSGGVMPISMGLSMIWYSDLSSSSLRLRPEAGFGMDNFKLTWGYNAALTNKRFTGIDKHLISLQVLVGVKKIAEHKVAAEPGSEWLSRHYIDTSSFKQHSGDTLIEQHSLTLIGGISSWQYAFGEIGLAYENRADDITMLVALSEELLIGTTRRDGTKFSQLMSAGKGFRPVFGYSLIAYTDYSKTSWVLRPVGGIAYKRLSLMYGYNWFFTGRAFSEIAAHNLSLTYQLCLKRFKDS